MEISATAWSIIPFAIKLDQFFLDPYRFFCGSGGFVFSPRNMIGIVEEARDRSSFDLDYLEDHRAGRLSNLTARRMSDKFARFNAESTPATPPHYWTRLLGADHRPRMGLGSVNFQEVALYEGEKFIPCCAALEAFDPTDFPAPFGARVGEEKPTILLRGGERSVTAGTPLICCKSSNTSSASA